MKHQSEYTKAERRAAHAHAEWRRLATERNAMSEALSTIAGALTGKPNESATTATIVLDVRHFVERAEDARMLIADIVARLDGAEWTSSTCSEIADLLRARGFTVNDAP